MAERVSFMGRIYSSGLGRRLANCPLYSDHSSPLFDRFCRKSLKARRMYGACSPAFCHTMQDDQLSYQTPYTTNRNN